MFNPSFYSMSPPTSPAQMESESPKSNLKSFMDISDSEFNSVKEKINALAIGRIPREEHITLTMKAYKDAINAGAQSPQFEVYDAEVKKKACASLVDEFREWKEKEKLVQKSLKQKQKEEKQIEKQKLKDQKLHEKQLKEKEKLARGNIRRTQSYSAAYGTQSSSSAQSSAMESARPIAPSYSPPSITVAAKPKKVTKPKAKPTPQELPERLVIPTVTGRSTRCNLDSLLTPEALDLVSIVCKLASLQLQTEEAEVAAYARFN